MCCQVRDRNRAGVGSVLDFRVLKGRLQITDSWIFVCVPCLTWECIAFFGKLSMETKLIHLRKSIGSVKSVPVYFPLISLFFVCLLKVMFLY